jgi:hypothetical protein
MKEEVKEWRQTKTWDDHWGIAHRIGGCLRMYE